jgi:hypothetical protein
MLVSFLPLILSFPELPHKFETTIRKLKLFSTYDTVALACYDIAQAIRTHCASGIDT